METVVYCVDFRFVKVFKYQVFYFVMMKKCQIRSTRLHVEEQKTSQR